MWQLSAANKNGDTYHECFKTIDEAFDFVANTIGEENLTRFTLRYKPECK